MSMRTEISKESAALYSSVPHTTNTHSKRLSLIGERISSAPAKAKPLTCARSAGPGGLSRRARREPRLGLFWAWKNALIRASVRFTARGIRAVLVNGRVSLPHRLRSAHNARIRLVMT